MIYKFTVYDVDQRQKKGLKTVKASSPVFCYVHQQCGHLWVVSVRSLHDIVHTSSLKKHNLVEIVVYHWNLN